jgi:hypothetical protein
MYNWTTAKISNLPEKYKVFIVVQDLAKYNSGISEDAMQKIAKWCSTSTATGKRTAYATFEFASHKDVMFFLLRWG